MLVRIRLRQGRGVGRQRGKNRQLALACGSLLIPASLMAYVLGVWRLTSDMGVTGEFAFSGVFSHWQLWIGTALSLHFSAWALTRYGKGEEVHLPRFLTPRIGKPR